jgi:5,6-dimethylbenzimidazole synthase
MMLLSIIAALPFALLSLSLNSKTFSQEEQDSLEQILMHRRDVRGNHFLPDEISDDTLQKILNAAVMAPSVGFSQPWEFVVIRDHTIKQKVAENFVIENDKAQALFKDEERAKYAALKLEGITESPINIAVFYKPSSEPILGQTSMTEMGEYSVVCAVQNMWLMARALNVGIGWVSILDPDVVKMLLSAPAKNKLVAYLCVGHVDEFLDKPELELLAWKERRIMESVVFRDGYKN